jgi:hypothetical protein
MVTDGQVRRLFREFDSGTSLALAAARTGMSDKTARHYRDHSTLPSTRKKAQVPRTYRTRLDPFAAAWPTVEERLRAEPRLLAKTLFDWLRREYPGQFLDSHRRTFERRVRQWRATHGPGKTIVFRQVHEAGDLAASDFTHMNTLKITIAGQRFDHMVYHFVLTYSNWESVTLCASESFEALSDGLQNALWELGGVPRRHRSDSLTAAVNNLSATREFQTRYRDLLAHYGVSGQRINARQAHENGDAESSHGHFKTAVDQALLLRGSREFASRAEYVSFLQQIVTMRNSGRQDRFAEELRVLRHLPDARLSSCLKVLCRVDTGSLIHIHRNTYSVHSRLRGEQVEARLFADRVEVWYADKHVDTLPRLVGRDRSAVHYRHVIDSLVRKPGAFANYAYREDLFPTTRFRLAYDRFCEGRDERRGAKDYLKILHHAAHNSEVAIDDALRVLLANDTLLSVDAVIALAKSSTELPAPTMVVVEPPDLKEFDALLTLTEETHGEDAQIDFGGPTAGNFSGSVADNGTADRAIAGTPPAGVPRSLPEPSRAGCAGESELPAVPGGLDQPRMRSAHSGPHPTPSDGIALAQRQDLGPVPLVTLAKDGAATVPSSARRRLPETSRKRLVVWQARLGKDARPVRGSRATRVARACGPLRDQQPAGAGAARRQTRPQARTLPQEAGRLRGATHRRSRLRAAEPRRDGSALHTAGGALRARQRDADEQLAVLTVDGDLQGPDDHRSGDRSAGASQRDRGTQRAELPIGKCEGCEEGESQRSRPAGDNYILTRLSGEF